MNVKRLTAITRCALPVLIVAFALPVFAVDVTYTTTGEFCAGPSACPDATPLVQTPSAGILLGTYPNVAYFQDDPYTATVNTPASPVVAAQFDVSVYGASATPIPANEVFTLFITQTAPPEGTGSLVGAFSGSVDVGSNSLTIAFNQTSVLLGNTLYSLNQSTYTFPTLSHPSSNDYMYMTVSTVTPEPTFMMLTGLGFAGVAFVAYRRRRTA
jgi:hypothetical protein